MEYFDQVNTDFYLPKPLFALSFMKKNTLNLTKLKISDTVAKAIANFLEETKEIK